jgi:hypothetical protein
MILMTIMTMLMGGVGGGGDVGGFGGVGCDCAVGVVGCGGSSKTLVYLMSDG